MVNQDKNAWNGHFIEYDILFYFLSYQENKFRILEAFIWNEMEAYT